MEELFKGWQLNPGASEEAIRDAELSLGYSLPPDYVRFFRDQNGGEGFIDGHYLILWKVEELSPFNCEYEVEVYAPGLLLFASSGGGTGYGFDTRDTAMPVVSTEFIGMNLNDVERMANTFTEFLHQFVNQS